MEASKFGVLAMQGKTISGDTWYRNASFRWHIVEYLARKAANANAMKYLPDR